MNPSVVSAANNVSLQTASWGTNLSSVQSQIPAALALGQALDPAAKQERFAALVGMLQTLKVPTQDIEGFSTLMHRVAEESGESEVKNLFNAARFKEGGSGIGGYISRLWSSESWSEWTSARTDLGKLVAIASDYSPSELSKARISKRLKSGRLNVAQACIEAVAVLNKIVAISTLSQYQLDARQLSIWDRTWTFLRVFSLSGFAVNTESISVARDGGFALMGSTYNRSAAGVVANVLVTKLNASGGLMWAKTLGDSKGGSGSLMQATSDGGFVFTGCTSGVGVGVSGDALVVKLNASGGLAWAKTLGGSGGGFGTFIQVTSDGGFVLIGDIRSFSTKGSDMLVTKLNANGDLVWAKGLRGANEVDGMSIQATPDGGFVLTGNVYVSEWDSDILVAKLNKTGELLWAKALGGSNRDYGYSIQATSDGGFVLMGNVIDVDVGGLSVWVVKGDASGSLVWAKVLKESGVSYSGNAIQATRDGGFVLMGNSGDADGSVVFVIKLDGSGSLVWGAKTLGGLSGTVGNFIQETSDGGFVLAGSAEAQPHGGFFAAKLNGVGGIANCSGIHSFFPNITDLPLDISVNVSLSNSALPLSVSTISMNEQDVTSSLLEIATTCSPVPEPTPMQTTASPQTTIGKQTTAGRQTTIGPEVSDGIIAGSIAGGVAVLSAMAGLIYVLVKKNGCKGGKAGSEGSSGFTKMASEPLLSPVEAGEIMPNAVVEGGSGTGPTNQSTTSAAPVRGMVGQQM